MYVYIYIYDCVCVCVCVDSLRGSSVRLGTIQRKFAWPLRKDDTHKSISVNIAPMYVCECACAYACHAEHRGAFLHFAHFDA